MRPIIHKSIYAFLALVLIACAGSSGPSMPTLPTAGILTAGATSSAAQVQGAPVASGAPGQIMVFPFATSTADVTLNQGLGARLYANYEGQDQGAAQAQLAQSTAQNICGGSQQPGQEWLECGLPATRDPGHGQQHIDY